MTPTSDPILLLHGALGSREQLEPLRASLAPLAEAHAVNFAGHGGAPFPAAPFGIPLFAADVLWWLDSREIPRVRIVGYSLGGYVGLWLAWHHPSRVSAVATIATKFRWTPEAAAKEAAFLSPATLRAKAPSYAAQLEARHGGDRWESLVAASAALLLALGAAPALTSGDLRQVAHPVLVGVGDRDVMVSVEESAEAADALPNGSLLVLPSTPHPIEKAPVGLLGSAIRGFFDIH